MWCKPMLDQWLHPRGQIVGVIALSVLLGVGGCASKPAAQSVGQSVQRDRPLVVATNTVLCNLTQQIAADTITLKCLIDAGADPHEYRPKPDDLKAIERATLILYGGYNFEPEIIRLIKTNSNPAAKIPVDEVAVPNPQSFEEDGKAEPDPHVFHNAANGAQLAVVIGKNLAQLQPQQAALYTSNTQKVVKKLTQIHAWIKAEIATIPPQQRKLVTTHDAFGYYSKAYGIPVVGALQGINTEEKATPARVRSLVQEITTTGVPTIFAETTINPQLLEAVAKEARVKIADRALFADGLGEKGSEGDSYEKLLLANTRTIVEGLGGQYTPFQAK